MEEGLRYLSGNPKAIFFTDFDGTITLQDCNDYLVLYLTPHSFSLANLALEVDNFGFGVEKRRMLELEVLKGTLSFRDAFQAMLDSVRMPFENCLRIVQENVQLDPRFLDFYAWAKGNNVPIVILSSGMTPVIEALLTSFFGRKPENIFVVANDVEPRSGKHINMDGGWRIRYRDDSTFGHDKSLEIKPYVALPDGQRPVLLFAGDGVSDLSAASETHILFAKEGLDLVKYCEQSGIPFVPFKNWASILETMQDIHECISNTGSAGYSLQGLAKN
ncbi:HAD-like domain-containing protein [Aspergillus leporis]|uniref:HAD-like domain-containing protein n=1 Tax=Aspergillus leporis TaxID=41062 RepID=A0A5N5X043_9EURO|nr:HAD-like domain-containing protein [Aspergillus leporis]